MSAARNRGASSVGEERWPQRRVDAVIEDCFYFKNWQRVTEALDAGFPANAKDWRSCSLLHFAAWFGSMPVLRRLLAAGADVNARNGLLSSPAHLAAEFSCVDGLVALVEAGADLNARDTFGRTPLHYAVSTPSSFAAFSSLPCTRYLLSLPQVDLSASDIDGMTAEEIGRSRGAFVAAEAVRAEVRVALGR